MRNTDATVTQVYNYVKNYLEQNSFPPSVREICAEVGIKSTATAYAYLEKLQKQGLITKTPDKKRAFSLTQKANTYESIPLVGVVTAGVPILAVENVADNIEVSANVFRGNSLFFLNVRGDSMINAGILDGDLIAVNKQDDANNGDIVVAMLDGEATVKRFYREPDCIRLQPENDAYEPIRRRDITVVGKVVGLIRSSV